MRLDRLERVAVEVRVSLESVIYAFHETARLTGAAGERRIAASEIALVLDRLGFAKEALEAANFNIGNAVIDDHRSSIFKARVEYEKKKEEGP